MMKLRFVCWLAFSALISCPAWGQFVSGSDGSDGAFNPQGDVEIQLDKAIDAPWATPSPSPGDGVYDADEWAVVFKYTTINIPLGVTVTFHNHPKGAPVVWLATGDVTIAGTVILDGADAPTVTPGLADGGPGGFSGGVNSLGGQSGGFGPGGAQEGSHHDDGQYANEYGTSAIVPLIGGSGAASGGGAGGGAILIASSGTITFVQPAVIQTNGGEGGLHNGSGGGVRLIANEIAGVGTLRAHGGDGAAATIGRIRLEAVSLDTNGLDISPLPSLGLPGTVFPDLAAPRLRIKQVDGHSAPLDPLATILSEDVFIANDGLVTIEIEANNVPVGCQATLFVVPENSTNTTYTSGPLAGTFELSTALVMGVLVPPGRTEFQLRVQLPCP